jgi:uncharacterized protein DUF4224
MNTPSIGLTVAELFEVTGFKYPKKQIHALALMEIPFKVRPDGTPFVARAAIEGPTTRSTPEQEAVLTLI